MFQIHILQRGAGPLRASEMDCNLPDGMAITRRGHFSLFRSFADNIGFHSAGAASLVTFIIYSVTSVTVIIFYVKHKETQLPPSSFSHSEP